MKIIPIKKDSSVYNVISKHTIGNTGHNMDWENIKVVNRENQWKKICIAEMVYIKKEGNKALNKMRDLKNFSQAHEAII